MHDFITPYLSDALGAPAYLLRDVLVRLFYSLSDGTTPFVISTLAIAANVVLDGLFVRLFGAPGLVAATAMVNVLSALALFVAAADRLKGRPSVGAWKHPCCF